MNTPLALPAQHSIGSDLRGISKEVITTLAGIAAAVGMVAINPASPRRSAWWRSTSSCSACSTSTCSG